MINGEPTVDKILSQLVKTVRKLEAHHKNKTEESDRLTSEIGQLEVQRTVAETEAGRAESVAKKLSELLEL